MAFSLAAKCMKSSRPMTPSPSMSRNSSAEEASRIAVRSPTYVCVVYVSVCVCMFVCMSECECLCMCVYECVCVSVCE